MELVNTNNESSFDPTPRLKSSPIPIKFISFNENDENCVYCGEKYIKALFCWQKYCKKCLSRYINDMSQLNHVTDYNIYLDVYIYTMDLECSEHEISRTKVPQNIQECCGNCLRILCFKQVNGYNIINYDPGTDEDIKEQFKLCSDCYIISSECIESTLVKKKISIVYLPWWHNNSTCDICNSKLTFTSDCQKYCIHCYLFYIGCRYCLTTNIFFGPACQSQCKKCKKISSINIDSNIDGFAFNNIIYDNLNKLNPEKTLKNIDKYFRPVNIIASIFKKVLSIKTIKWIPYSQFTDVKEITKGGYGIIYKATWLSKNENVILKRFENSKNDDKYFLNELKSIQHCFLRHTCHIIETYGFTKDPKLEDYIIVMKYASEGDLHKHLQKNFTNITWNSQKQLILWQISEGSKNEAEFFQAEAKRKKLIESKKIGPEFAEKRHPEAIYTSRPISALISKCSSINSSSTISSGNRQDSNYISVNTEFTDIISLSSQNLNSTIQNYSTTSGSNYILAELEFDIDTKSLSTQNLSSIGQNFSTSSKRNRNEVFLNIETHDNSVGKRIKTSSNYP
ncbi:unnamed protein product [Rhizophagus irregularis]|nr:unnamed protein product [Rhizophagus irregularis]